MNGDLNQLNFTLGNVVGTLAQVVKKQDEQDTKLDLLLVFRAKILGYAAGSGAIAGLCISIVLRFI